MRLIDADEFKKQVAADAVQAGAEAIEKANAMCALIDKQETAYDIEAVKEQMKNSARKMSTVNIPHTYYKAVGINKVLEIIDQGKTGGTKNPGRNKTND